MVCEANLVSRICRCYNRVKKTCMQRIYATTQFPQGATISTTKSCSTRKRVANCLKYAADCLVSTIMQRGFSKARISNISHWGRGGGETINTDEPDTILMLLKRRVNCMHYAYQCITEKKISIRSTDLS